MLARVGQRAWARGWPGCRPRSCRRPKKNQPAAQLPGRRRRAFKQEADTGARYRRPARRPPASRTSQAVTAGRPWNWPTPATPRRTRNGRAEARIEKSALPRASPPSCVAWSGAALPIEGGARLAARPDLGDSLGRAADPAATRPGRAMGPVAAPRPRRHPRRLYHPGRYVPQWPPDPLPDRGRRYGTRCR